MNSKALIVEFVGTFALIFIGRAGALGVGGLVGVALAHGLVLMVMAAAYGDISGAHINPAVTIGLWAGRQIKSAAAAGYILVQLLGNRRRWCCASSWEAALRLGATVLGSGVSPVEGLVVEAILTFFLVNTIYQTAVRGKAGNLAPVAIGMTLAFGILMGGPLTGASLNPARTIGPAVAVGNFGDLWVYLAGPVLGGLAAAALYRRRRRGRTGRAAVRWPWGREATPGGDPDHERRDHDDQGCNHHRHDDRQDRQDGGEAVFGDADRDVADPGGGSAHRGRTAALLATYPLQRDADDHGHHRLNIGHHIGAGGKQHRAAAGRTKVWITSLA
jgi:aquaporin Z